MCRECLYVCVVSVVYVDVVDVVHVVYVVNVLYVLNVVLPRSGIEPVSPASPGGLFITEPPGKPSPTYILMLNLIIHDLLVHSADSY